MTSAKGHTTIGLLNHVNVYICFAKKRTDTFNLCNYFGIKSNCLDQYFSYRIVVLVFDFGPDFARSSDGKCSLLGKDQMPFLTINTWHDKIHRG
jgi:hypothetical protein